MITAKQLIDALIQVPRDAQVRIGDVSEGDDLHCSVGKVIVRNGNVILVHGDDEVWKDETLASLIISETLWPKEEASED